MYKTYIHIEGKNETKVIVTRTLTHTLILTLTHTKYQNRPNKQAKVLRLPDNVHHTHTTCILAAFRLQCRSYTDTSTK